MWNTCNRPEVKAKLLKELSTLPNDFNYDHLKNLHYLNHVVDETLRLYSAVPAGLPRVVPPEGANMGGYFIPGGSIVSTQAYGMHRIEEIFPDALQWTPERWESPTQAMKDAFVPWGGGSRSKYLLFTSKHPFGRECSQLTDFLLFSMYRAALGTHGIATCIRALFLDLSKRESLIQGRLLR